MLATARYQRHRLLGTAGRRELVMFGAIYVLYDTGRWIFHSPLEVARRHSHSIFALEHHLHAAVEANVQRAFGSGVAGVVLSNVYLLAQLIVLPAALISLYRRDREVYRQLRSTVAGVWLISTPIFALYPVAPPRLAGIGITDTVSHRAGIALTGHSTMFYNPYAAVPSLHVGLAFAIGIALAAAADHRYARLLALAWGPLVTLAVIATGNHYLFDAAAGLLVTGLAHAATRLISHRPTATPASRRPSVPFRAQAARS